MTHPWPWPDDRLARRSRVAHIYRDRLADEAPAACAEVDALMVTFGQDWALDSQAIDPEALLTVRELAEAADVAPGAVRNWVYRWPLRSYGVNDAGRNLYRWGDVIDHQRRNGAT